MLAIERRFGGCETCDAAQASQSSDGRVDVEVDVAAWCLLGNASCKLTHHFVLCRAHSAKTLVASLVDAVVLGFAAGQPEGTYSLTDVLHDLCWCCRAVAEVPLSTNATTTKRVPACSTIESAASEVRAESVGEGAAAGKGVDECAGLGDRECSAVVF